ncbi:MAG TPA: ion transporter [Gammaproteobacteria bacterium]|nr:ion transporter [Gammaproteobacteria bacterium]|tara:strand:- start:2255 stop:3118 length:864 start_codon:yes stop_codon:yes gene_type:complete
MTWHKDTVRTVIFEADTRAGRAFDVALIIFILMSVAAVMLDSVPNIHARFGEQLFIAECVFTGLFAIEYGLRLWCIQNSAAYARSFYGIVDLFGILPTLLSVFFPGAQLLIAVRILRVLRVFRVLRLVRYVGEAELITQALAASRRKITVFICTVLALMVVFGSLMYLLESGNNPQFSSIPKSIYWAITTMTTVGYGDVTPTSAIGQALAAFIMIMGYGIIAVPTGIVTIELNEATRRQANTKTCSSCAVEGHIREASYCWRCGASLYPRRDPESEPGERGDLTSKG